jgi:site-specific DNA-methyltransferase (adenine-specific)
VGWLDEMSEVKLYLGDCLEIMPTLAADSVDLVFADPPFNLGKIYGDSVNDSMDLNDYYDWCDKWIDLCFGLLKPGGAFYLMTVQNHVGRMMNSMEKCGSLMNQIIWLNSSLPVKNRFCIGYQPILYYVKRGGDFTFNYGYEKRESKAALPWGRKNKGNSIKDIWDDIPFVSGGCMAAKEAWLLSGTKKKAHPAQMPIKLSTRMIGYSSNLRDTILDPFMGSGTTSVACVQTGRNFIGIEIEPKYYEIAKKRIKEAQMQLRLGI